MSSKLLMLAFAMLALANACDSGYPTSGDWCDDLSTVYEGTMCWANCITGCGGYSCATGETCVFNYMGVSKSGGCVWPTDSNLCCVHMTLGANGTAVKTLKPVVENADARL